MVKKGIAVIVTIILFVAQIGTCVMADTPDLNPPSVSSASAILMDAQTGEILYTKNAHTKRFPASTTKIMTCLLALEKAVAEDGFDTVITANADTVDIESGSSNAGIRIGEELTVEQLLYFAMVVSGNDAANALGQYVSDGDLSAFSQLMTTRAAELGCKNTFFWNAHGLNEAPEAQDKHMTSAYDLALIMKQATSIPKFIELISTTYYEAPPTNKTNSTRKYTNTNKLILPRDSAYYEYCIGGKTGWTTPAGNTLVTYAEKNDRKLICVVLKASSRNVAYADTKALYEYGFSDNNFEMISLDNAFPEGEMIKTVSVTENGKVVGSAKVYADIAKTLYIPAGCSPQELDCQLICVDSVEKGEELKAYVSVTIPTDWQVYGYGSETITLEAIVGEITYLPDPTPTDNDTSANQGENDGQNVKDDDNNPGGTVLLVVIVIIIVMFLLVMIRRYYVWKRRRKKKYWWKEQL